MGFKNLEISNWKQYGNLNIEFHPRVTILTGANGAGKTTILKILSQHFGWPNNELSTPYKDISTGIISFFNRFFRRNVEVKNNKIGSILYQDGGQADLNIPQNNNSPTYGISIASQRPVQGFYIPSHRPPFVYTQLTQLSTVKRSKSDTYNMIVNNYRTRAFGAGGNPSSYHIKETLLTWAINGYGNAVIDPDLEQRELYEGFQGILKQVMPKKIGFKEFIIRNYEVVFITSTGEFMLDAVSGGISSIVDLAWQIYMFPAQNNGNFVVLIDEVENHLHAEMQRELLPSLLKAFPNVQFIVSTHSPLIIGSVKDSNTYALFYTDDKHVEAKKLDLKSNASDANKILRNVLGVPVTMPIWVEEDLNGVLVKLKSKPVTKQTLEELRSELLALGLEDLMPEAVIRGFSE